ncbi:MAG: NFACT family protein [Nanobdellota archaeon]
MVFSVSSVDVHFIVKELQELLGGKLDKVFQQSNSPELLFSFHVSGVGKRLLYISLPSLLCLSSFKPSFPQRPPHFAFILRKRLSNARLQEVSQVGFDRIIELVFSTKESSFKLFVELFSPGNVILTDVNNTIREVFSPKIWSEDRKLIPNRTYQFPDLVFNPTTMSFDEFTSLVACSDKENIVKTLAIECSLGGVYAEEVLFRAGIDKNALASTLSTSDIEVLYSTFKNLFSAEIQASVVDNRPFPIIMKSLSSVDKNSFPSFNTAIAHVVLSHLEQEDKIAQEKKVNRLSSKYEKIIQSQSRALKGLQQSAKENQRKGELIYSHYTPIKQLLSQLDTLRKTSSWDEIKAQVKGDSVIKRIDEHKGIVYLDLE